MCHRSLRAGACALPPVLLLHALAAWCLPLPPVHSRSGLDARLMATVRVVMPVAAIVPTPQSRHAMPMAAPRPIAAAPAPAPAVGPSASAPAGFHAPKDLERVAVPRSAPDISLLEGLPFSGLPMRLRLYVTAGGEVVEVEVLQAAEADGVMAQVRQMFLATAFVAARAHGEDVASFKDVELALAPPK